MTDHSSRVPQELHQRQLDGVLRAILGTSWASSRKLVETGKVTVAGEIVTDPNRKVRAGDAITVNPRAPRPRIARVLAIEQNLFIYVDAAVAVVRKPAGVSTVPFGDEPDDTTLDSLARQALARRDRIRGRAPLGVVQRLDKETSGVLVFARSLSAKKHLAQQLRNHSMFRRYFAIVYGSVGARTFRSHLVPDRGDGFRGSVQEGRREGLLAITHVVPVEELEGATLIACRLETGRTHQIRIHLAEAGHPVVGDRVYDRDRSRRGPGTQIPAPRLMLHAAELGFVHPTTGEEMRFEDQPPPDFAETLARLSKTKKP